jgi:hypothetical protein
MTSKGDTFREILSHDQAIALVRDIVDAHGAEIQGHNYDPMDPAGTVQVQTKTGGHTAIPYELPDDRKELREMAIVALANPKDWQHAEPRR